MRWPVTLALALTAVVAGATCEPGSPPVDSTASTSSDTEILPLDLEEALAVLFGEALAPASLFSGVSAYLPSAPLTTGTVVVSESGGEYEIEEDTWFVFIDDSPEAFYAHDVRYVFIDTATGEHDVVTESWPPDINGKSLWATAQEWHLVEIYSILDEPMPVASAESNDFPGDYGDAPIGHAPTTV